MVIFRYFEDKSPAVRGGRYVASPNGTMHPTNKMNAATIEHFIAKLETKKTFPSKFQATEILNLQE